MMSRRDLEEQIARELEVMNSPDGVTTLTTKEFHRLILESLYAILQESNPTKVYK